MNQVFEYIRSLDWANNWAIYILSSALIIWFSIFTFKLLINKLTYLAKKLFFISVIAVILALLSYMFFLVGFIEFDVLSLVGLGGISTSIQEFLNGLHEWFKNIFSFG